jgi:hypothetical protein
MANIQTIISIASLLGLAHLFKIVTASNKALSFFHISILISLILYVGALAAMLAETAFALRTLGAIGFILLARDTLRAKISIKPESAFIVFSIIGFYLLCNTSSFRTFSQVDDFGHWARVSRYIFESNALLANHEYITHHDYPPIAALFQYFFTHFSGFEDRLAIFAQGILIISGSALLLRPLTDLNTPYKKITFCIGVLGIYSLYWIFSSWFITVSLGTLSVDLLLGVCFGLSIYVYHCQKRSGHLSGVWEALPILLFIVLLKPIGIVFAMVSYGIIFTNYLSSSSKSNSYRNKIYAALANVALILVVYASWKFYLRQHNIGAHFAITFNLLDIFHAFDPSVASARQTQTIQNFINYIFLSFHTLTYWFIVCVSWVFLVFSVSRMLKIRFGGFKYFMLLLGFAGYLLLLLILYMFSFSEWEGTRLASIDRYSLTFVLGILIFLWGNLIFVSTTSSIKSPETLLLLSISLLFIMPNFSYIKHDINHLLSRQNPSYVERVALVADQILNVAPPSAKVYFVYSDGSDDESSVFNYLLIPRATNRDCSFIRPFEAVRLDSQPWVCYLTPAELVFKLSQYDFVVFAKITPEFISYYEQALNISLQGANRVFSISTDKHNGGVTLTKQ